MQMHELKRADWVESVAPSAAVAGMSSQQLLDLPPAHGASSAAAGAGPEVLLPYRSSLSGAALSSFCAPPLPFASLRLPSRPLLARGTPDNSSAHLGLVAIDPDTSVINPEVLRKMKLEYVRSGCKATLREAQQDAESESDALPPEPPRPPHSHSLRKRKSSTRATAASAADSDRPELPKKAKTLPLVSKASLITLDKQLSREQASTELASKAQMELAAYAFARHLVDWADAFEVDSDSDEEEGEEVEGEQGLSAPADVALDGGSLSHISARCEWMLPAGEAELASHTSASATAVDRSSSVSGPSSSASTPAFVYEHQLLADGSTRTEGFAALEADTLHFDEEADTPLHMEAQEDTAEGLDEPSLFAASLPYAGDPARRLLSPLPLPLVSTSPGAASAFLCMSPLALSSSSPKVSPTLLAHLASPHFIGDMLPMTLDAPSTSTSDQLQQQEVARMTLAHTTTSAGARVELTAGW